MIELNKEQKRSIDFESGIANVLAVPGSGKTLTMTYRISHLISKGTAPESILGLTFTRNAAQAMRERLYPVLGSQASRVMLCTIHSFCHWILRSEGKRFEILYGKEQIRFIRKIIQRFQLKSFPTGMVLQEIALAKCNLVDLDEFRELYAGDESMQRLADIYEAYVYDRYM